MNGQYVNRRQAQSWHLKKEINISLIISVIGIAITTVLGYADIKKEIALIQADVSVLHQRDDKNTQDLRDGIETVSEQYLRLEAKLDRLIENGHK